MKIQLHTAQQYGEAIQDLLPPGQAWQWQPGGFGDSLMVATGQELARMDTDIQGVLDNAIETHRPKYSNWNIREYRRVALEALGGVVETMPRKMFAVGSHVGDRLWSHSGPSTTFPVPLVQVDHLIGPLRVGSHVGDRTWGTRSRYVMRVRYYASVVDPKVIWDALMNFKQAHVFLWFEDITGSGGEVSYAQN